LYNGYLPESSTGVDNINLHALYWYGGEDKIYMFMKPLIVLIITSLAHNLFSLNEKNLLANHSFENDMTGWHSLWTREEGKGKAECTTRYKKVGTHALAISHRGSKDWSIGQDQRLKVIPGEVYEFSGWIQCEKIIGAVQLSVVLRDSKGIELDWLYGLVESSGTHEWKMLVNRFIVPEGCDSIQFRITGFDRGTCYADDFFLLKKKDAPDPSLTIRDELELKAHGASFVLNPFDHRITLHFGDNSSHYTIEGLGHQSCITDVEKKHNRLLFRFQSLYDSHMEASITIQDGRNIVFSMKGNGRLTSDFPFPGRVCSHKGESWVIPSNEGLLIPVDDPAFSIRRYDFYSGHSGLCMPFLGLTDGERSLIMIAETPDDGYVLFHEPEGDITSGWTFTWQAQKGRWGYERRLCFQYIPQDGYVGIAKAYRHYAEEKGLLVTLREKRKKVPAVDLLVGAANIWWWKKAEHWTHDPDCGKIASDLKNAGMDRVLWSNMASPKAIEEMNMLGFLTSRYDIYQDVWDPKTPVAWLNKKGWPEDIVLLPDGTYKKGWVHRERGKEYPGGIICSKRGFDRMKQVVSKELETHAYRARFIDTTTASSLTECYHPDHPLSRTDDRMYKSRLLNYISSEFLLVTGSETGIDWALPFLHYFEGMMSLAHYRLPDAGYDLTSYKKPHKEFLLFQTGPFYRIPLFQLVYHDCAVSFWYWGDSSNRIPEVWDDRDLFNMLYGTGPLYIMDTQRWKKDKKRFIESYTHATAVSRRTGYDEMLTHRFLTPDHTVQYSSFADGTSVWVNFGNIPYRLENGTIINAGDFFMVFSKKIAGSLQQTSRFHRRKVQGI
jgi:hypothetical protein